LATSFGFSGAEPAAKDWEDKRKHNKNAHVNNFFIGFLLTISIISLRGGIGKWFMALRASELENQSIFF
jgi:hypothetical protein